MVKHIGPIKSWRPLSTVSHHLTSLCGVHISSGWSLPTTFSATCLSMFEVSLGYQPSLLSATEGEYAVPSVQHHLCHCCCFWRCTWVALLRTKEQNKCVADHHMVPTLPHQPGQKVWLSIRNIPLWTESKKLTPCFIDPFEIQSIINAVSVCLNSTSNVGIHNYFHVSQLKLVQTVEWQVSATPAHAKGKTC